MNLQQIKTSVARVEQIDDQLKRISVVLEFLTKPGNTRAILQANASGGTSITVTHEFSAMLYVAERERLTRERAELATALRLEVTA